MKRRFSPKGKKADDELYSSRQKYKKEIKEVKTIFFKEQRMKIKNYEKTYHKEQVETKKKRTKNKTKKEIERN